MKKYIITQALFILSSITSWGAVGDEIYVPPITYTILKECVVESTTITLGSVMVGINNGYTNMGVSGDVKIPDVIRKSNYIYSVGSIGKGGFYENTKMVSVTIPNSVSTIDKEAFYRCTALESVILEATNSISISNQAFYGCTSLRTFDTNAKVLHVYDGAFSGCTSLTSFPFDKLYSISPSTFLNCSGLVGDIVLDMEHIDSDAFNGCTSLSSVALSNKSFRLGKRAFANCSGIKRVYSYMDKENFKSLPDTSCFSGVSSEVTLYVLNGMKSLYESDAVWHASFPRISVMGDLAIGERFSSSIQNGDDIETFQFEVIDSINSKVSIVSSTDGSLSSNTKNIDFKIPLFVTNKDLTYHVKSISPSAFRGTRLSSIVIGKEISSIGDFAFSDCSQLRSVTVEWRNPSDIKIGEQVFGNIPSDAVLYVPAGTKDRYEAMEVWNIFSDILESDPVSICDIDTYKDTTVNLSICLNEAEQIAGMQFRVTLPNGFSLVENEEVPIFTLTERTNGFTMMGKKDPDVENSYLFVAFSYEGNSIHGNDGVIFSLKLKTDSDLDEGIYDMIISDIYLTTSTFETLNPNYVISELTINSQPIGDVNGDGDIDIADAVCIVNYVVGKPNAAFIEAAADVDGDGVVDIADAVRIVNLVVGKITALAREFDFSMPDPQ